MESYVEITFFHNCLVNLFCLYLAHACSFCEVHRKQFFASIALVGISTCFFHPYSFVVVLSSELFLLLTVYRHREFIVFLMMGFRLILNLWFYFTIEGSIYNGQFFIEGEHYLWMTWFVLLLLILSLHFKGKFELLELFFVRTCFIEQIKCRGYLDSGNFLFVEDKPVIFLSQGLFDHLTMEASVPCHYQTVSDENMQWGKVCHFSFDRKKWVEVICLPMEKQGYDCLINMKGIKE